ncbi:MAG: hypothetical protein CL908_10065 [Deltaproteobacteria bacterium]|nr:hypothetical protein [Deltaproteobacteria bacterium]
MRRPAITFALFLLISCVLLSCGVFLWRPTAEEWQPEVGPATRLAGPQRSPCVDSNPLRSAFFGDLHVHTRHSMDARSRDMLGSPDDAYRFARGEAIGFGPFDALGRGQRKGRLERPLDFAAVTDHAEWIGEVNLCSKPGSKSYDSESCRAYRGEIESKPLLPGLKFAGRMTGIIGIRDRRSDVCGPGSAWCRESLLDAWQSTQKATERWNDTTSACRFTAFHGWEHSYSVNQSKVHRNVIFRNASVPEIPISSLEAPEAIDLWDRLDALCTNVGTGCEVLTIPHNPNVSNGRLFEITWARESAEEQRRQASVRARIERLVEVMQIKGESECKNGLWGVLGAEDELCTFEKLRDHGADRPDDCEGKIGSGALRGKGCQSRVDFARYALVEGLREEERIGINPFQFGLIGSTDTHNASPGDVEEYSFMGCCANKDATVAARLSLEPAFAGAGNVMRNPGGLMGVWAEENSRDALFDAMKRRETFATSGPRISPRFFGGWDLPADLCERGDLVEAGYAKGVPMGGVLPAATQSGRAPAFVASVARDPGAPGQPGGQLDRLQIIKAWADDDGNFHQAVHDVAGRLAGATSREPASVDLRTCEPQGYGHDTLCAVWTDPDFDPSRKAVYYARVVENPSCRWSWRECLAIPEAERPESCRDANVPRTIQERAWTSPIWVSERGARGGHQ